MILRSMVIAAVVLLSGCSRNAAHYLAQGKTQAASGNDAEAVLSLRKAVELDNRSAEAFLQLGRALARQSNAAESFRALEQATRLAPSSEEAAVAFGDACLNLLVTDRNRPQALYDKLADISNRLLSANSKSFDGWRFKGSLALVDRRYDEAMAAFSAAAEIRPDDPAVIVPWGRALLEAGQGTRAEQVLMAGIEKHPNTLPAYDLLYSHYTLNGKRVEARQLLLRKVERNPLSAESRAQLAADYVRQGEQDEAERTLRQMLDDPRKFPDAPLHVGDFHYRMGKLDRAVDMFRQGLTSDLPRKTAYRKRLIEILAQQGKVAEARTLTEEALKDAPGDEELRLAQAKLMLASGTTEEREKAVASFRQLVEASPQNPGRRLDLGRAFLLNGDLDAARGQVSEALRRMPASTGIKSLLADIHLRKQEYQEALRLSDEILAAEPRNGEAALVRAACLMGVGKFSEARAQLARLSEDVARSIPARLMAGNLRLAEGKLKEAEALFVSVSEANPGDARPVDALAKAYLAQRRGAEAVRIVREAAARQTASTELRLLLARTAWQAGDLNTATDEFRRLVGAQPRNPEWRMSLGEALRSQGKHDEALQHFQEGARLAPRDVRFLVSIGATESLAGRKESARDWYRKALSMQPGDPLILNNLAYVIAETGGDLNEAQRLARQAIAARPDEPGLLDTLGVIQQKAGQTDGSLRTFEELVRLRPDNPLYRYRMAVSLAKKGDKAKAREALQFVVEKYPASAVASDARQLLTTL